MIPKLIKEEMKARGYEEHKEIIDAYFSGSFSDTSDSKRIIASLLKAHPDCIPTNLPQRLAGILEIPVQEAIELSEKKNIYIVDGSIRALIEPFVLEDQVAYDTSIICIDIDTLIALNEESEGDPDNIELEESDGDEDWNTEERFLREIRIVRADGTHKTIYHPHINKAGILCLGTFAYNFLVLGSTLEIGALIDQIKIFLTSYNEDSVYWDISDVEELVRVTKAPIPEKDIDLFMHCRKNGMQIGLDTEIPDYFEFMLKKREIQLGETDLSKYNQDPVLKKFFPTKDLLIHLIVDSFMAGIRKGSSKSRPLVQAYERMVGSVLYYDTDPEPLKLINIVIFTVIYEFIPEEILMLCVNDLYFKFSERGPDLHISNEDSLRRSLYDTLHLSESCSMQTALTIIAKTIVGIYESRIVSLLLPLISIELAIALRLYDSYKTITNDTIANTGKFIRNSITDTLMLSDDAEISEEPEIVKILADASIIRPGIYNSIELPLVRAKTVKDFFYSTETMLMKLNGEDLRIMGKDIEGQIHRVENIRKITFDQLLERAKYLNDKELHEYQVKTTHEIQDLTQQIKDLTMKLQEERRQNETDNS